MVRELVSKGNKYDKTDVAYKEFAGTSLDEKPKTHVMTGSLYLEVDTGDIYAYDETSTGTWGKIAELGGGS